VGEGFTTAVVRDLPFKVALAVSPTEGVPKSRRFIRLSGLCSSYVFGVHDHNLVNVLRGLRERVFGVEKKGVLTPTPKPAAGAYARLGQFRSKLLARITCLPWSYDELILSYRGAKQRRVQEAVASLQTEDVTQRDAELQTFVKAEKINISMKPDPAPRVIQPRSARYNASVGRFLKAVEHPVYAAIARVWGGPTVMKGYNAEEVAEHIVSKMGEFGDPVAIGLDASRFDQHVSVEALQWEHSVYNAIFNDAELRRLLTWQIKNKGVAYTPEGAVRYSIDGCRMSGDMNTALGNCLLMCALVWAYTQGLGIRCSLVNNGDDCVVFMERKDQAKFMQGLDKWFLEMGFNMKVEEPVYDINHIEFCQTKPIEVNGKWTMVRDPFVSLAKDAINLKPDLSNPVPTFNAWAKSVGQCGLRLAGGVPVVQDFYMRLTTLGKGSRGVQGFGDESSGFEFMARRMDRGYAQPSAQTRYQFWAAFGITPDEQVALEEHIRSHVHVPSVSQMMSLTDFESLPLLCKHDEN